MLLQAHSAALGIALYTAKAGSSVFAPKYRGELFVALHGSWNRNSRTGYKVVRVKLKNGKPTGEYEDFLTGFVADGRGVWGRPVGVAVAQDGALLITEDADNTVWRISPTQTSRLFLDLPYESPRLQNRSAQAMSGSRSRSLSDVIG